MDRDAEHKTLDWISSDLLMEFIDELHDAGYNIGISQYIAAHDLILSLTSQNLLLTPDRLGSFLGPILCSSSAEQEDFRERFRKWAELVQIRNSIPREKLINPDGELTVELGKIKQKSRKLKFALIAILFAFPPMLWMSLQILKPEKIDSVNPTLSEYVPVPESASTTEPESAPASEPESAPASKPALASESTCEPSTKTFDWRIAFTLCLSVSGLVYLAWRMWWLSQARLFLQRRQTRQTPQLDQISFQGMENTLFNPLLMLKTAQRLRHRIRVSTNTLDINKTINASLQNGGWFTPVYGYCQVFPEYLFLIDRASIWDHQATLIEKLTHQLRENDVYITTYFFDGDPRVCSPSNKGSLPQTLQELSTRYQQHRLVAFADVEIFSDIQTAKITPWADQLLRWKNPVVITPKPLGSWGRDELILAQSFTLLPLTENGIQVLGQIMQEGTATYPSSIEVSSPIPTILKARPKRWIERNSPTSEQAKEILLGLRNYLGDHGLYWLAACAVFPEIRWNITLYLGNILQDQEGNSLLEHCSIVNLARLPWYRYGYMPDWLRGYLIATLTQKQKVEIRTAFQKLLMTSISGSTGNLPLEIAMGEQSFLLQLTKPILRLLSKQASENTALKDYIFLDFMSKKSKLAVEVPEEILPLLRKYSQSNTLNRGKRKISITLASSIVMGLLAFGLWSLSIFDNNTDNKLELNSTLSPKLSIYAKPAVVKILNQCYGTYDGKPLDYNLSFQRTGFFINPSGYIVTSGNVIGEEECKTRLFSNISGYSEQLLDFVHEQIVLLPNANVDDSISTNNSFPFQVKNNNSDIAIIKISVTNAPTLKLGDSSQVQIQDPILAVGYPTTVDFDIEQNLLEVSLLEPSITVGRVSNSNKQLLGDNSVLQIDIKTGNGSGGSPLIDVKGEVIGMLASQDSLSANENSIASAIPTSTIKESIAQSGTINEQGVADSLYREGLANFGKGNCQEAKANFLKVKALSRYHSEVDRLISEIDQIEAAWVTKPWTNPTYQILIFTLITGSLVVTLFFYFLSKRNID